MSAYFNFQRVAQEDRDLMEEIYRVRYQVYCLEAAFLDPKEYPNEMEEDEYDPHSIHFVAQNSTGPIGTVRLIVNSSLDFPLEQHCAIESKYENLPRNKLAEVSRLAVSKTYRRRAEDKLYGIESYLTVAEGGIVPDAPTPEEAARHAKRRRPEIVLGLYRAMYQESKRAGIEYWYAAMERKLARLLRKFCFEFNQIGEQVDYYGPVIPFLAELREVEKTVAGANPDIYSYFVEGLEEQYLPK